ncbi:uncharacterized protein VTP21DRAFT_3177 [Calcarisporiella thermophila]|uniref:uncharacterized protein n=1 Tax=Calcarisporiella thermophila TaxID=911321 RepID=UPI003742A28A
MTIKLYHLVTKRGDISTAMSPYCLKIEAILNFKGLKFESIPLTFLEIRKQIPEIIKTEKALVPVLVDGDTVLQDSRVIAEYLERKYPEPSIFQGGRAVHYIAESFYYIALSGPFFKLNITKLRDVLDEENRQYFVEARTKIFGDLDALGLRRDEWVVESKKAVKAIREHLKVSGKFICGEKVGYADFVIAGSLTGYQRYAPEYVDEVIFAGEDKDDTIIKDWFENMRVYF